MKIDLEFKNVGGRSEKGCYEFAIHSCCSPSNLWVVLVKDSPKSDDGTVTFQYWKVISLMEVSVALRCGVVLHGKVATVSLGNYDLLQNVVLDLSEGGEYCIYLQRDSILSDLGECSTYVIDLDELRESPSYTGLGLEVCIKRLLLNESVGYDIWTRRVIDASGNIRPADECD